MSQPRATIAAPLVIFPVALVFVAVRALLSGDLRELFASPFSAAMITVVGYPIAVAAIWLITRISPKLMHASLGIVLGAGIASAELSFWLLVHPVWERDFSNLFCAALVAACGAATATILYRSGRRRSR